MVQHTLQASCHLQPLSRHHRLFQGNQRQKRLQECTFLKQHYQGINCKTKGLIAIENSKHGRYMFNSCQSMAAYQES